MPCSPCFPAQTILPPSIAKATIQMACNHGAVVKETIFSPQESSASIESAAKTLAAIAINKKIKTNFLLLLFSKVLIEHLLYAKLCISKASIKLSVSIPAVDNTSSTTGPFFVFCK